MSGKEESFKVEVASGPWGWKEVSQVLNSLTGVIVKMKGEANLFILVIGACREHRGSPRASTTGRFACDRLAVQS